MHIPQPLRASVLRILLITVFCTFFAFLRPATASADTGRYLIDIGVSGSYQTSVQGWNNIYSGNSYNVPLVDSAGTATNVKLTVTPTPPASLGNTNGTTGGPYPATATQDTFYTSTTGYNGTPAQFVYTITGLSSAQTYNVTLYASRIGTGGEVRSTLYTIGSSNAVLNASENINNSVTISNVTPVNGQIVITQQKDASNTNPNGFSYLGVIDIAGQAGAGVTQAVVSTPQVTGKKIVVLGSSTAAGTGASSFANSWVGKFTTYMQSLNTSNSVVNLGVGGYNTYTIMPANWTIPAGRPSPDTSRNITYALSLKPDAIIVNMPSNDTAAGYPISEQQANFQTIVSLATAAGVPIWIATTQPRNFDATGIAKQITMRDWITATYGARSIDFWTGVANPDGTINSVYSYGDGIHLNDTGHQLLYSRVVGSNLVNTIAAGAISTAPTTTQSTTTPVPGPTVEATAPQTITAPVSTATLAGYVSVAPSRTIAGYKWEETSARGAVIQSPTSRTTLVSNLLPGTYTFKLTVTDSGGAATSATVSMTVQNAVPTVGTGQYLIDIGSDAYKTTTLGWNNIYTSNSYNVPLVDSTGATTGATFTITPTPPAGCENTNGTTVGPYPATATRDSIFTSTTGYCGSPSLYTYTISGLSQSRTYNVTLYASRMGAGGDARSTLFSVGMNKAVLDASENVSGVATISNISPVNGQITITQEKAPSNTNTSGFSYLGVINVTSQAASGTTPPPPPPVPAPTANAGTTQTITAPASSVTLSGSGVAGTGRTITAYKWTQTAGSSATITSPNAAVTSVTNLLPGSYTFQLTVTDSAGVTGTATVAVTVLNATPGPTVSAGSAQTITAPANSVTLAGSASAASGRTITAYSWREVTSNGAPIQSPTSATTLVSNLVPGSYTFQLTATDSAGVTGSATVQVTVLNAVVVQPTADTGRYLIDFGSPSFLSTMQGWNNIYTGKTSNVPLVDSTGAATGLTLTMTPTPPGGCENTNGTTAGPYPASATLDSFYTATSGYCGVPSRYTYTISGLSSSRTYNVSFYASRIGSGGEIRTAAYTINGTKAVLNAAENITNIATISGVTPVNGQIVITQEKDTTNNNANGFSYLGVMEITARTVSMDTSSMLAGVLNAVAWNTERASENAATISAAPTGRAFSRNLKTSMTGADVRELQRYLNAHGFAVATAGEGSLGNETTNFGQGTKQALIRFQNAHAAEILTPAGLSQGNGYLGALTRQYINTHP